MISEETAQKLQQLLASQPTYKPNQAVQAALKDINVSCFVGATCVGKTTLMDALVAYRPQYYGKTRNFTSRPPRADDDPKRYYYYEHSDAGLAPVFARIAQHENLQHNINPYNLTVYGSELADYPHPMNVGDIFSSSIDGFRQLGFGTLHVFSVVTDPDAWRTRLEQRFPSGHPQLHARLEEAVASLTWSLTQTAQDHAWVINPPNDIQAAVTAVDAIIRGENASNQAEAQNLATACLEQAKKLLNDTTPYV
ncbi:hypothetical protein CSA80_02045 [Candidatus Saccharibacteria bacterium]|nr:MAG: hypothetical protein CSA80_02045 [Candidatus Saccharibacteria bacterium]